jgi:hypothetical protein
MTLSLIHVLSLYVFLINRFRCYNAHESVFNFLSSFSISFNLCHQIFKSAENNFVLLYFFFLFVAFIRLRNQEGTPGILKLLRLLVSHTTRFTISANMLNRTKVIQSSKLVFHSPFFYSFLRIKKPER